MSSVRDEITTAQWGSSLRLSAKKERHSGQSRVTFLSGREDHPGTARQGKCDPAQHGFEPPTPIQANLNHTMNNFNTKRARHNRTSTRCTSAKVPFVGCASGDNQQRCNKWDLAAGYASPPLLIGEAFELLHRSRQGQPGHPQDQTALIFFAAMLTLASTAWAQCGVAPRSFCKTPSINTNAPCTACRSRS